MVHLVHSFSSSSSKSQCVLRLPLVHPYVIFFLQTKNPNCDWYAQIFRISCGTTWSNCEATFALGKGIRLINGTLFWGEILQGYFYIWNCSDLLRICKSTLKTKTRLSRHISNNYKNDSLIVFIYWYVSSLFSLRRLWWRPW